MENQEYQGKIYLCNTADDIGLLVESVSRANTKDSLVQIFNPKHIINEFHIRAAYMNTIITFADGSNIAKKEGTELLLFAAMTTQINYAFDILGVRDTKNFILFSNNPKYPEKLKNVNVSEFKPSIADIEKNAMSFGIKFKTEIELNKKILLNMVKSRI